MKNVILVTLLLGSFAAGCQDAGVTGSSKPGSTSSSLNAIGSPTSKSSSQSEAQLSASKRSPVAAPQSVAEAQQTCDITAFVIDKDPKGLNVRSAPGESQKIVGNLPTTKIGVIVDITGSKGNWVQLSKAESPDKVEFQGTGWVYSQLLGTSTRGYGTQGVSVYKSANTQSSVMGRIPPATGVKLLGCSQSWALVEHEGLKGWIEPEAQCGNPLSTCP
ncbi:SH3 domain-containing protein [Microcoleus sp. FACHB-53]|nr:SH3 domain-containing protein [Microcoleus sp. FACHB-53]